MEYPAFRIGSGFSYYFLLPWRCRMIIVVILLQWFLPMRCAIRFNFLIQLLLIAFRCYRYGLFHLLFQIRICFDMCSIHKHNFRRQVSRASNFFQDPPEHAFDHFRCKSMPECVADCCKVRQLLRHGIPPVSYTHLDVYKRQAYDETVEICLDTLLPLVAKPHMPDNVETVEAVGPIAVDQVFIGSCTNSSYQDMMRVARILKGCLLYTSRCV